MRILLVEDDKDLSSAIKRILLHNNYDVDVAYDGVEALEFISFQEYQAIIMDLMIPKIDGITAIKKIRSSGNNTPILILTAKTEIDDKVIGLDAGADDYLTKPFQIKELLARIRAISRRSGTEIKPLEFANCVLNPNTFELIANESVRLTNKEYKLMELLIINNNMILSTQRILDTLWEFDADVEINVVWVFISMLRKKLEQIGANCYIKAIRGLGYQLEVIKNA